MYFVARFFAEIIRDMGRGSFKWLSSIDANAEIRFFSVGTFRGPAGAQEAVEGWMEVFPGTTWELREFIDPPRQDEVVLLVPGTGAGGASGVPVDMEVGYVVTIQNGMATRFDVYSSMQEALEAAGLSE